MLRNLFDNTKLYKMLKDVKHTATEVKLRLDKAVKTRGCMSLSRLSIKGLGHYKTQFTVAVMLILNAIMN